jgi:mannose-1-phosphate guanylyltransferase
VLNGDIYTDLDIAAMIGFHLKRKAKATIALTPVDDPTSYGLIETNAQGRVTRFLEKPKWSEVTTNMINAGTYVLEPEALNRIPPQANFSFEHELFPLLLDQGEPVCAYTSSAYWIDIGTPEKYFQLHRDLFSGNSARHSCPIGDEVLVGEQSYIHPTVHIRGPAVIGSNCIIGHKVKLTGPVVIGSGGTIQEDTVIEESIIWRNAQLGQRVSIKNSIIADNCRLNDNTTIEDSILGDSVTVVSGCKLEPGSKIWSGRTVEVP